MGLLEVNPDGLRTLAASCRSLGAELGNRSCSAPVEAGVQATAAAVNAAHGGAAHAAQVMAARMRDTASSLEDAGSCYVLDQGYASADLRSLIGD